MPRTELPAASIVLGTNCGGSDGNCGVTANPALGVASDLLVAQGGTGILGETPEIYGAEHLLTRRAVSREVGEKLVERIKWWEWYTGIFGAEINNNPSPGNKDGGLTTIYEKSLGAIAKGGTHGPGRRRRLRRAGHGEGLRRHGHARLRPGVHDRHRRRRGQRAGLHDRPRHGVRLQAGAVDQGRDQHADVRAHERRHGHRRRRRSSAGTPVEEVGRQIFEEILAVASGKKTKSELNGVGEEEFAPWSIGPTM